MGAGASMDPMMGGLTGGSGGDGNSQERYFCHECHTVFLLDSDATGVELMCSQCHSPFVEHVESPPTMRTGEHNSNAEVERLTNGFGHLTSEQARRITHATTMLRLLELQLRDELSSLQNAFENTAEHLRQNNARTAAQAALRRKALTSTMKLKLKEVPLNIDMICSQPSCPICSEDFTVDSKAMQLPCSHLFHGICVMPWLEQRQNCPICRNEMSNTELSINDVERLFSLEELKTHLEHLNVPYEVDNEETDPNKFKQELVKLAQRKFADVRAKELAEAEAAAEAAAANAANQSSAVRHLILATRGGGGGGANGGGGGNHLLIVRRGMPSSSSSPSAPSGADSGILRAGVLSGQGHLTTGDRAASAASAAPINTDDEDDDSIDQIRQQNSRSMTTINTREWSSSSSAGRSGGTVYNPNHDNNNNNGSTSNANANIGTLSAQIASQMMSDAVNTLMRSGSTTTTTTTNGETREARGGMVVGAERGAGGGVETSTLPGGTEGSERELLEEEERTREDFDRILYRAAHETIMDSKEEEWDRTIERAAASAVAESKEEVREFDDWLRQRTDDLRARNNNNNNSNRNSISNGELSFEDDGGVVDAVREQIRELHQLRRAESRTSNTTHSHSHSSSSSSSSSSSRANDRNHILDESIRGGRGSERQGVVGAGSSASSTSSSSAAVSAAHRAYAAADAKVQALLDNNDDTISRAMSSSGFEEALAKASSPSRRDISEKPGFVDFSQRGRRDDKQQSAGNANLGPNWICSVCLFENNSPLSKVCQVCDAPDTGIVTWTCSMCRFDENSIVYDECESCNAPRNSGGGGSGAGPTSAAGWEQRQQQQEQQQVDAEADSK